MTFFASLVLIFLLVIRPQEIWPALAAFHLLDATTGLVVLGLLVELALGKQKLYSPQLPFLGAFIATCYVTSALAVGAGPGFTLGNTHAMIPTVFMLAVMYGARTLPRLKATIWLLLVLGAFVSAVAVHQGRTAPVCLEEIIDESGEMQLDIEHADGRECGQRSDCRDEARPGVDWACERLGLFNTVSTGRRVRWRGQLDDPNELSVFIGAVIPLLFAVARPSKDTDSSRGTGRQTLVTLFAILMVGFGLYAVILSQSRGGQLVVGTVFMLYFVSRVGKKGILLAIPLALPILLLGGRDDAAADESAEERLELLYHGASLVLANPIFGVGVGQFADRVESNLHLTAHNSYLLAAAELGFPGFFFWSGIVWTSVKVSLVATRNALLSPSMQELAMALLVSFIGIGVGIFFLSFTFKQLLFVWFGMAGAFYGIAREADPSFEVKIGWKDCLGLVLADVMVIALIFGYTRVRGVG